MGCPLHQPCCAPLPRSLPQLLHLALALLPPPLDHGDLPDLLLAPTPLDLADQLALPLLGSPLLDPPHH
jgi:hypothetical protein